MNAPTPAAKAVSESESAVPKVAPVLPEEIDRSCCAPVTFLLAGAAKWLLIGLVLGLISSIKLHAPSFLADISWLSYGRVYPASLNAIAYGFASQAALGVALWLLARLGRVTLARPGLIIVGALLWNIGVVLGIVGILLGHSTGYLWLEIPGYASPLLFAGYVLVGFSALSTFHARREHSLYVSQWYLLAALLWFPWIYSTAQLLLVFGPTRGTLQAVVGGWFAHNFFVLWLTPIGLAAIFYFIPKLLNRPLHSHYLALFAFWSLLLFGSWGGVYPGEPVPKWIPTVSVAATVMTLIPLLAVATNWHLTMSCERVMKHPLLRFMVVGAAAYLISSALEIVGTLRTVSEVTAFTFYSPGVAELRLFGFIAMSLAGALYYILPRITQCEWPSPQLIQVHFWMGASGAALVGVALVAAGIVQGLQLRDTSIPVLNAIKSTIPLIGLSTLGDLLLIGANVALLANFAKLLRACGCCACACGWLVDERDSTQSVTKGPAR